VGVGWYSIRRRGEEERGRTDLNDWNVGGRGIGGRMAGEGLANWKVM
jgi:hypothetical protein